MKLPVVYVRALDHESFVADRLGDAREMRAVIEAVGIPVGEDEEYIYLEWLWKRGELEDFSDRVQRHGVRVLKSAILEKKQVGVLEI